MISGTAAMRLGGDMRSRFLVRIRLRFQGKIRSRFLVLIRFRFLGRIRLRLLGMRRARASQGLLWTQADLRMTRA